MKTETKKEKTGLRRQTVAVIVLAGVLVLLIAAQIIAAGLVKIYTVKDTYVDENGAVQTVKYTVKRDPKTGLYALYNKKGEKMELAPESEGNAKSFAIYETESGGNQYRVNTATGEVTLYASVDTEGDEIAETGATKSRLLMFPRISESDFASLEVQNSTGKFRLQKEGSNVSLSLFTGEDWALCLTPVDAQAFAYLRAQCAYTLTRQKLDLSSPAVPRLADGSVNYAAYGLDPTNAQNPPAVYTITNKSGNSYTVLVGNLTVTGEGYYVKRADHNAVYILDAYLSAVLSPVESLVTPTSFYSLGETTYPMVELFSFEKVISVDMETEESETQVIAQFTYQDLAEREYTLYQTTPYVNLNTEIFNGYSINDLEISDLLARFYTIQYLACKKLMPDYADLADYGLSENCYSLSFYYNTGASEDGSGPYVHNWLLISQKTYDAELGQEVYYVYSPARAATENEMLFEWGGDMIVAVDPYYFSFVEWEQSRWYSPYYFSTDLAFLRELHLTFGEKQYDFYLDNSKTSQRGGLSSSNLEITCPQYDSPDHKLNYEVHTVVPSDTGGQTPVDYTGEKNFKRFMAKLFMGTIEGDVNRAQFQAATGKTVEEFIASDTADDQCVAKIRYHLEDYAADYNSYYDGNNYCDLVLRFYEYDSSGRKCLLTVEVLERDAAGNLILDEATGEPLSNPTRATGLFYSNASSLGVFAGYAEDLLNKVLIPQ